MTTRLKHWIVFCVVSALIWLFVPTNFLIFFPVVVVWIIITAGITTVILSLWAAVIEDD